MASLAREASERPGRGFGQFRRLANGTLERLKKMGIPWPDWLLLPKGVAFGELWDCEGVANGTVERPEEQIVWLHWLVKLPRGLAEVLGSFEGWQTALLNALKRWGCRGPTGSHCEGLANGTVERP